MNTTNTPKVLRYDTTIRLEGSDLLLAHSSFAEASDYMAAFSMNKYPHLNPKKRGIISPFDHFKTNKASLNKYLSKSMKSTITRGQSARWTDAVGNTWVIESLPVLQGQIQFHSMNVHNQSVESFYSKADLYARFPFIRPQTLKKHLATMPRQPIKGYVFKAAYRNFETWDLVLGKSINISMIRTDEDYIKVMEKMSGDDKIQVSTLIIDTMAHVLDDYPSKSNQITLCNMTALSVRLVTRYENIFDTQGNVRHEVNYDLRKEVEAYLESIV